MSALARDGHAYLDGLAPLVAILFGVARSTSRWPCWFAITLSRLAVYICQESREGLLAAGHSGGPITTGVMPNATG